MKRASRVLEIIAEYVSMFLLLALLLCVFFALAVCYKTIQFQQTTINRLEYKCNWNIEEEKK